MIWLVELVRNGHAGEAVLVNQVGTMIALVIGVFYVVVVDSPKRWPNKPWWQRLADLLGFRTD